MTSIPLSSNHFSPGIRALLPMLYTAWSDRLLSPSEAIALREQTAQLDFLSFADKKTFLKWSNPRQLPNRELFKLWEIKCREGAQKMPRSPKVSLTELGLFLVNQEIPITEKDQKTLLALEQTLGQVNPTIYQQLFLQHSSAVKEEEIEKARFPIEEMTQLLDGPYQEIKSKMRALLADPVFELQHFPTKEAHREQVLHWCQLLANQGMGALSYAPEYGGKNKMGNYAAVFEMLGFHDNSLTIKFGVQFGLWGGSVQALGTKKHHDKYLKDIGTLELPGCFAMTETGHGSNVRGLETTAIYDKTTDEIIIHSPHEEAGKEYIGNAAIHGQMATVFAQLIVNEENHGVHAILVPLRDKKGNTISGVRIEDNGYKLGLNGVDNGRIWFNEVRVSRENLLDKFGQIDDSGNYSSPIQNPSRRFFTMLGTLVGGRVCVPRAGLSAAKKALSIAVLYAAKRRQFGKDALSAETPILDYPSHQRRLMPLLAKAYAIHFGLDEVLQRYVNRSEEDIREIETLAAGLKSYATWFTTDCIQECREACGGKGYLTENQFAALKADTDIYTTFEGDNTVLLQLVAKGLLTAFNQSFHEDGNLAVLRYLGRQISVAVSEQNPLAIRNTDESHLLSYEFQESAFTFREAKLLNTLVSRLRGHIKDGKSSYKASLICQTHMIALAKAFAEGVTLRAFQAQLAKTEDEKLQKVLAQLCSLYALHTIEEHKGWFLENDYLAGSKSKAIRRQVDKLCLEIREEAVSLVEAFGIPEVLVNVPML